MMLQFGMAALFFLIHPVVAFVDARLCRGSLAQNQGIAAHRSTHAERMLLIQFRQDCMEILFECFSSRIIAAGHEHQELIAAHAGRNAVSRQCPPDRLRHHAQGRIAALMAMGIVDGILRLDSKIPRFSVYVKPRLPLRQCGDIACAQAARTVPGIVTVQTKKEVSRNSAEFRDNEELLEEIGRKIVEAVCAERTYGQLAFPAVFEKSFKRVEDAAAYLESQLAKGIAAKYPEDDILGYDAHTVVSAVQTMEEFIASI